MASTLSIEIENLVGKLLATAKTAQEERELLIAIKKSIDELRKYDLPDCNYDISEILMLICEKNVLLAKQGQKYINTTNSRMKRLDVVDYAREKKVIITSPSTLPAILVTINMVRIEAQRAKNVKEISKQLATLGKQFEMFAREWEAFSKQLDTASKSREKLDGRVSKITTKFDAISSNSEIEQIEEKLEEENN